MATWEEIRDHVRSRYRLVSDEPDSFSMVWLYEDNRSQLVEVRTFEAFDAPFVEFRSVVCKESEMAPRAALVRNEQFALGGLALDGDGNYFMFHRVPLSTLGTDDLELPLFVIARTADKLEEDFSGSDEN